MKKIIALLLFGFAFGQVFGQQPKKIKLILLGTFHFNQSLDSNSRLHSNLFSDKRQQEVNEIVNLLANQKPDKIFLEFTPADQHYYDSVYQDYLQGKEPQKPRGKANEIFQLGMKTAKKLGLKEVIGMNYQPLDFLDSTYQPKNKEDKIMQDLYLELDKWPDTTRTNTTFYDLPTPYKIPKQDSLLQKSTLKDFLLFLNSTQKMQWDDYTNWNFYYSIGTGNEMVQTDYVGTFWYGTNVRNFNNVLRQIDYKNDKCYLIIYGSSHVSFLKFLFQQHPYFDVVDINSVLQ